MPYEKIQAPVEGGEKIRLLKLRFGTSWYAAGPCHVALGGTSLTAGDEPAIAVIYHNGATDKTEQHINLRRYSTKWLTDRWLNPTAAELLIDLSLLVCKPDDVEPGALEYHRQVCQGDYYEALEKIRDEIVGGVKEGSIKDRRALRDRVCACIENSVYRNAYEMALDALRFCEGRPAGQVQRLAKTAMYDGVMKLVHATAEFNRLPKKATV